MHSYRWPQVIQLSVGGHGLRQQLLDGSDPLEVEWYPSLRAAILGLEKNFFAGYDYHLGGALASNALLLAVYVWPWLAAWRAAGWRHWLVLGTIAAEVGTFLKARSGLGARCRSGAEALPPAVGRSGLPARPPGSAGDTLSERIAPE